ncbi:MAG: (2Fe-2S)-binding protein [Actinobacteria bacterium]|nr:(2Fe-2S)-binding protein [Actinomycetota bacterium]
MNTVTIDLQVNGTVHQITVAARTTLADLVRDHLDLTGTHLGCEHGVCGACTVLVDGAPTRACITLAASVDGGEVTTVEGLDGPVIDALRDAFSAEHGLQCGFCTPGMLVSCCDIVRRRPGASRQDIREELAGNICRCTGYVGIVDAVQRAMAELDQEVAR